MTIDVGERTLDGGDRLETTRVSDDGTRLITVTRWIDRQVSPPKWRSKNQSRPLPPKDRRTDDEHRRSMCEASVVRVLLPVDALRELRHQTLITGTNPLSRDLELVEQRWENGDVVLRLADPANEDDGERILGAYNVPRDEAGA